MLRSPHRRRRVCFATGTRAEFGLMRSTLIAIQKSRSLDLQLLVTGMHLDRSRGYTADEVRSAFTIDAMVPWRPARTPLQSTLETGRALARMAEAFYRLDTDIVLVVGDRVEAFAAASAGMLSGKVVAHVHGGDRAMGQVDDSLRHAITKLSHIHFPATQASADRIKKLGEESWRIHQVGTPGIDDIDKVALPSRALAKMFPQIKARRFALIVLHPVDTDAGLEGDRARLILNAAQEASYAHLVIIHPNTDPGAAGISEVWKNLRQGQQLTILKNAPRPVFLALMRDCATLVGNSSSGIIEAGSFGTPVIDIGPRQEGREHGENVVHVSYDKRAIKRALMKIWNDGHPTRFAMHNVYGGGGTGKRISDVLARADLSIRTTRKIIAY